MDASETEVKRHARTYHRLTLAVKWFVILFAAVTTLLVLWFATPVGFWGALVTAALVLGAGVYAMNHGLSRSSEQEDVDAERRAERSGSP